MSIAIPLVSFISYTRTVGNDFPYGSEPSFEVSWRKTIWLPMVFLKLTDKMTILCDFFLSRGWTGLIRKDPGFLYVNCLVHLY